MSEWQPIETAPRDGSKFDARCWLYPPKTAYFNGQLIVHHDRDGGEIAYPFTHWKPRVASPSKTGGHG